MAGKTFPELASIQDDDIRRILREVGVDSKEKG